MCVVRMSVGCICVEKIHQTCREAIKFFFITFLLKFYDYIFSYTYVYEYR